MTSQLVTALKRVRRLAWSVYSRVALKKPWIAIGIASLLVALAATGVPKFQIDASGDSLLLESDVALGYYRGIREKYGSDDFLILTYTPKGDLFSDVVLDDLQHLRDKLASIDYVDNVTSMLDVPLFESPPVDSRTLAEDGARLLDPRTDRDMARDEFHRSPLYRDRLLSADGQTTAIQLDLQPGDALRSGERQKTAQVVAAVRTVVDKHDSDAEIHLGGLPMISTDMLSYIRHDLKIFGAALFAILVAVLGMIFRQARWVVLPLLVSSATILGMAGIVGYLDWPVTVVSSNFASLLLILTLSLNVHLAVRYRELAVSASGDSKQDLVATTVRTKFVPALLTAITTMVAFGSLTVAGIRPVIDFGWMMVVGIGLGFILTFLLLPPSLVLLSKGKPPHVSKLARRFTAALLYPVQHMPFATLVAYLLLAIASTIGLMRLSVDNRFIDYFDDTTEIHEGMVFIDRNLGGTTPLDIIIDGPSVSPESNATETLNLAGEAGFAATSYWLKDSNLQIAERIHRYLDEREHIGSVLSVHTSMYVIRRLADTEDPDSFTMSLIYNRMPDEVKEQIISPYLSEDGDQLRFSARVYETNANLDRNALLQRIQGFLTDTVGIEPGRVHLSGIFVLYNNVLKSLLSSQLSTAATVSFAVILMFAVAFRSIKVALISIVPNLLGAAMVLSVLGFEAIPLDIMTITIAAIAIGIGVDDTIHYVHRFQQEYEKTGSYDDALKASHDSVGRAMLYTTLTIVLGFCVLAFSNFVPTAYFGVLTGLAMAIALVADLTLLPTMLIKLRAFGPPQSET